MLPFHAEGAAMFCEKDANTKDGSKVQCVDASAIFDGPSASAQSPMTLKRKFATVSLSLLATCALSLCGSPSTLPELARRRLDNGTADHIHVQHLRDGCTWMYYNPDDPALVIGTIDLRRSFIR